MSLHSAISYENSKAANGFYLGGDHYRLYRIDFAGKAIYPFENGLSLYGKLGFAFVHQSVFNQIYRLTASG